MKRVEHDQGRCGHSWPGGNNQSRVELALTFLAVWLFIMAPRAAATGATDSFAQLQSLLELAPHRHVGQPGNRLIDEWVQNRFARAVEQNNDPGRWQEAKRFIERADAKHQLVLAAADDAQVLSTVDPRTIKTAPLVKHTVEQPGFVVTGLIVIVMALLGTWYYQRRNALWIAASVLAVIVLVLPILSTVIETRGEAADRGKIEGRTPKRLQEAVDQSAREAYQADREAAKALGGLWQSGRVGHPTAVFVPGRARLHGRSGEAHLFQLAPNLVEPANLPAEGFRGPLVYIGRGHGEEMSGKDLGGSAVLIEFDSDNRWIDAVQLGAEVVIVLEPDGTDMTLSQAAQKTTDTPLSVPRFFLPRRELDACLGSSFTSDPDSRATIHIDAEPGRWQRQTVFTDWLLIPGTSKRAGAGTKIENELARQLVHIQAYKDSSSIVPERSPGAQGAANLALLIHLLEHFEVHPPPRPVLLSVVNDHTNGLYGEQVFAHHAFAGSIYLWKEHLHLSRLLARRRFVEHTYGQGASSKLIGQLRRQREHIGGRAFDPKTVAIDELTRRRNLLVDRRNRVEFTIEQVEQRRQQFSGSKSEEQEQQLDAENESAQTQWRELEAKRNELESFMELFNRFGRKTHFAESDSGNSTNVLEPAQQATVRQLFQEIAENAKSMSDQLEADRNRLYDNLTLRRRLLWLSLPVDTAKIPANLTHEKVFAQLFPPLPAALAVSLDLTFDSDRVGLFYMGNQQSVYYERAMSRRVSWLANYIRELTDTYEQQTGRPNRLVDTLRFAGGVHWKGHLGGRFAFGSSTVGRYGLPAFTFSAVRDRRVRAYTPHDTLDRINQRHFHRVMEFAERFLPMLIASPRLGHMARESSAVGMAVDTVVRKKDKYTVSLPKTTLPDSLVLIVLPNMDLPQHMSMFGQVRPWPILMTDRRGSVMLRGTLIRSDVLAFGFDSTFRQLQSVLDLADSKNLQRTPSNWAMTSKDLITFDARKVDLYGLTEPLALRSIDAIGLIDARTNSTPLHFGVAGLNAKGVSKAMPTRRDGTGSVFVEPHTRFKLRIGEALALGTTEDESSVSGIGFDPDVAVRRDLVIQSAKDMWRLTRSRLDLLKAKGVQNQTAEYFSKSAHRFIDGYEKAHGENELDRAQSMSEVARGLAYRSYTRGLRTLNDLIQAVVFLLILVIPTCFFLMKLVTPFTGANRQLALFVGIFVLMAIILQFVHPAFQVAETPHVVVLAFVILSLAIFVTVIVIGRFNTSMQQAVEQTLHGESMDAPQSSLAGLAFMVGINNMKRRRIRTTLTCATIVLVTLTTLSVISVGQDVEPTRLRRGEKSPYNGFVFTRSGLGEIDAVQMNRLRAQFRGREPRFDVMTLARAWAQRKDRLGGYLPYELQPVKPIKGAATDSLVAKVLLGLEVAEDGWIERIPIRSGGRWFSANDAREIVLSTNAAKLIGIDVDYPLDHHIIVQSESLRLVGLIDDKEMEQIKDLDNTPFLPLLTRGRPALWGDPAGRSGRGAQLERAGEATGKGLMDTDSDLLEDPGTQLARPIDVALVPMGFARSLGDAKYRTLSVKFSSRADAGETGQAIDGGSPAQLAWQAAEGLVKFQHVRLRVGLTEPVKLDEQITVQAGQYALMSSSTVAVGGMLKVAIPISLAATIIFNTMIGSVVERRREIGIYNAIGLNPTHVMLFFVAEALVFAMIGAVIGYLIGQILSMVVAKFGLLGDTVNLNYSSLSVLLVMFVSVATVMLSSFYPALMAARAAVPSGQRRWSLPQPDGDLIRLDFPFSYDQVHVLGVCAFLHHFMEQNTEASTGKFLAKIGPTGRVVDSDQTEAAYVMNYDVAPAPFDLGVNQKMEVHAYYNPRVKAHMLRLRLERMTGERSNWISVNQPFLELLRKRLLSWRSQREETQQMYCDRGRGLLLA